MFPARGGGPLVLCVTGLQRTHLAPSARRWAFGRRGSPTPENRRSPPAVGRVAVEPEVRDSLSVIDPGRRASNAAPFLLPAPPQDEVAPLAQQDLDRGAPGAPRPPPPAPAPQPPPGQAVPRLPRESV